jgi:hypothetical protein
MYKYDAMTDDSDNQKQVTLSSKCGNSSCIGIERDTTGNIRVVNVQKGETMTGFSVTDDELRAFIAGAAEGDFNHLLRESPSKA